MQNFYWIDDNPTREQASVTMGENIGVSIEFYNLKGTDVEDSLSNIVKKPQPTLIILDHNLEDAHKGIFKKGSTAATFIREFWPECPIVCVTGENIYNLSILQKSLYEDIYSYSNISENYNQIKVIADSYEFIQKNRPQNAEDIINLIKAPSVDTEKIVTILPTTLKENFSDNGLIVELSKWVRETMMSRPGFLYNKLWLSTLIGINESSFEKVASYFDSCKYTGIFMNDSDPRWWKSSALEVLYTILDEHGLPWRIGRNLPNITANDYSICYASNEEFPETVAYVDQTFTSIETPMKLKYTVLHPDFERLLYFDDVRLMKAHE